MKKVKVSAYSGYRVEETPRRFEYQGRTISVKEIIYQWRDEGGWGFLLIGDDERKYQLKYFQTEDCWTVEEK